MTPQRRARAGAAPSADRGVEASIDGRREGDASWGMSSAFGAKPMGFPLFGSHANNATLNSSKSISPESSASHILKYLRAFAEDMLIFSFPNMILNSSKLIRPLPSVSNFSKTASGVIRE